MKIEKFEKFLENLTPGNISQIPDTQLHKYFQYYKMWCDENGQEYHFKDVKNDKELRRIINIGIKYAEEHNLPNRFYYGDNGE